MINAHYIGRAWEVMEYEPKGETKYWKTVFKLDWLSKCKDGQKLNTINCIVYRKVDIYPGDIVEVWGEKGAVKNSATGSWEDKIDVESARVVQLPLERTSEGLYPVQSQKAQQRQQNVQPQGQRKTRPQRAQQSGALSPEDEALAAEYASREEAPF